VLVWARTQVMVTLKRHNLLCCSKNCVVGYGQHSVALYSYLGHPTSFSSLLVQAFGKHFHALCLTVTVDVQSWSPFFLLWVTACGVLILPFLLDVPQFGFVLQTVKLFATPIPTHSYFTFTLHCSSPHLTTKVTTEGFLCIEYLFWSSILIVFILESLLL
jgi:hypothetical protein